MTLVCRLICVADVTLVTSEPIRYSITLRNKTWVGICCGRIKGVCYKDNNVQVTCLNVIGSHWAWLRNSNFVLIVK